MNTKEQIIKVSLELFAQKGYDGVSVREIAKKIGVRESALYKHFESKEDILRKVIATCRERILEEYVKNEVPEAVRTDIAAGYKEMAEERLYKISWELFQLFTKDSMMADFRRLLMREQFGNKLIAQQYDEFFLNGVITKQAKTFAALTQGGFFKEEEAEIIALHFYGPILLLFQRYDCEPDQEVAIKEMLLAHIRVFGKNYSIN